MKKVVFVLMLMFYGQLTLGQHQPGTIRFDTTGFVDTFSNLVWEEIAQQLLPTFEKIYASDSGYFGLTIALLETDSPYRLKSLTFSNDTPVAFQTAIRSAIESTLSHYQKDRKSMLMGYIMIPLLIRVFHDQQAFKPTSPMLMYELLKKKPYLSCLILPINHLAYDQ